MKELLNDTLSALKDIVNAEPPYSQEELLDIVSPILGKAYDMGIRLGGEE